MLLKQNKPFCLNGVGQIGHFKFVSLEGTLANVCLKRRQLYVNHEGDGKVELVVLSGPKE